MNLHIKAISARYLRDVLWRRIKWLEKSLSLASDLLSMCIRQLLSHGGCSANYTQMTRAVPASGTKASVLERDHTSPR